MFPTNPIDLALLGLQARIREATEKHGKEVGDQMMADFLREVLVPLSEDTSEIEGTPDIAAEARNLLLVMGDPDRAFAVSNAEDLILLLATVSKKGAHALSIDERYQVLYRMVITRAQLSTPEQRIDMVTELYGAFLRLEQSRVSAFNPSNQVPMEDFFLLERQKREMQSLPPDELLGTICASAQRLFEYKKVLELMEAKFPRSL
jgi:hypothetical protein